MDMKISTSALLLTGSNTRTVYTKERAVCSLCSGGSEKEKAAQIGESGAAFSSTSYEGEYTSKGDNLQCIIRARVGGADHV
jgi:hypothetical protein